MGHALCLAAASACREQTAGTNRQMDIVQPASPFPRGFVGCFAYCGNTYQLHGLLLSCVQPFATGRVCMTDLRVKGCRPSLDDVLLRLGYQLHILHSIATVGALAVVTEHSCRPTTTCDGTNWMNQHVSNTATRMRIIEHSLAQCKAHCILGSQKIHQGHSGLQTQGHVLSNTCLVSSMSKTETNAHDVWGQERATWRSSTQHLLVLYDLIKANTTQVRTSR